MNIAAVTVIQYIPLTLLSLSTSFIVSLQPQQLQKIIIIALQLLGRPQLLEKWIAEDKLEMSEELGDLLMPADVNMALTVYQRANVPEKVINCLMQKGESDKIVAYSMSVGYRVDYTFMLQQLVRTNPQGALDFAKKLVSNETGPQLIDVNAALEIFLAANLVREGTAFLLEALKGNKKVCCILPALILFSIQSHPLNHIFL